MDVLYTADIHTRRKNLRLLFDIAASNDVECVIVGGDIIPKDIPMREILTGQGEYLSETFIPAVSAMKGFAPGMRIYLDLGNDDLICHRHLLEECEPRLFGLLHNRRHRLGAGLDLIGYMNVPVTPFALKDFEKPDKKGNPHEGGNFVLEGYRSDEEGLHACKIDPGSDDTIENDLEGISSLVDGPFIFVSHCPPYGTALDMVDGGRHAGSLAVKDFIERWSADGRLLASFHGHIHESPAVSGAASMRIGGTICVNPGQSGQGLTYAIFNTSDVAGTLRVVNAR